jgi:ferredoxin
VKERIIIVRAKIDREECTSREACWDACPEVFEQNPDDLWSQITPGCRVERDNSLGSIPEDLQECAQSAADDCPVEIINAEQD